MSYTYFNDQKWQNIVFLRSDKDNIHDHAGATCMHTTYHLQHWLQLDVYRPMMFKTKFQKTIL